MSTQGSLEVGTHKCQDALLACHRMMKGTAVLVAVRGIVALIASLFRAYHKGLHFHNRLDRRMFWRILQTLLSHAAWRDFPLLARHLPEILLGGTMCGCSLSADFVGEAQPESRHNAHAAPELKSAERKEQREQRFCSVLQAIDELLKWTKVERHHHMSRLFQMSLELPRTNGPSGLPPAPAAPVRHKIDLPDADDLDQWTHQCEKDWRSSGTAASSAQLPANAGNASMHSVETELELRDASETLSRLAQVTGHGDLMRQSAASAEQGTAPGPFWSTSPLSDSSSSSETESDAEGKTRTEMQADVGTAMCESSCWVVRRTPQNNYFTFAPLPAFQEAVKTRLLKRAGPMAGLCVCLVPVCVSPQTLT